LDSNHIIDVREISVRYGGVHALDSVSLHSDPGEVLGIIGPNGAGKTTLFDSISGLCEVSGGRISFDGHDATKWSAVRRARWGLRRTFQRQQVFARLTVEQNLLAACEWTGGGGGMIADLVHFPTRQVHERRRRVLVDEVLAQCGLDEVRGTLADALPIAAARLLELGRALIGHPRILLLDEPTSGLGARELEILRQAIRGLRTDARCALLLVEHDINFVMAESQHICVLDSGSVLAAGSPEEIQKHPEVISAYLGVSHDLQSGDTVK
jgi:branched-chain amino acid transport system ATP-binding protein